MPWIPVYCQQFFPKGSGSAFFEVQVVESGPEIPSKGVELEAIKKELGQAIEQAAEEERRRITEPEEAREPNRWVCRVGWVDYTGHSDRKALRELVALVGEDEPELRILCKAFDWLIQDVQYYTVRKVVGLEALFEANKKEVNKEAQMPFNSWMDITTVKAYTEVGKQLLRYIFRSKDIEPDKRLAYELIERQ